MEYSIGNSEQFTFTVKDSDGTAQALTGYDQIAVWLIDSRGKILGKYARETLDGHDTDDFNQRTQTGDDVGVFDIFVQEAITANANEGPFKFEVKLKGTNASFTDGHVQIENITQDSNNEIFEFKIRRSGTLDV